MAPGVLSASCTASYSVKLFDLSSSAPCFCRLAGPLGSDQWPCAAIKERVTGCSPSELWGDVTVRSVLGSVGGHLKDLAF